MEPEVISLPQAVLRLAAHPAELRELAWELPAVSEILSRLLGWDVLSDQLHQKGLALGLWDHSTSERACKRFTAQAVSRLLIAGFGLPAQADVVTLALLRRHLAGGLKVFVLLPVMLTKSMEENEIQLFPFELQAPRPDRGGDAFVLEGLQRTPGLLHRISPDQFARCCLTDGTQAVIGAGSWDDLPIQGTTFFGGSRDPDGSYHWDVAEYNTDRCGRVLRC
jgi:hypothetical protein